MITKGPFNWRLLWTAIFHSLFGSSAHFHTSSMNQIEFYVKQLANDSLSKHYHYYVDQTTIAWFWAAAATSVPIGCVIGALTLKYPFERLGRKETVMVVKNLLQILGSLLQAASRPLLTIELFLFGRLVSGLAVGFAMLIPVFLTECAPVKQRGFVATVAYLGVPIWSMLGTVFGLPTVLGTEKYWHYVLLVAAAPATLHLALTPLFPQSPKYLHINRRNRVQSEKAIRFYYGSDADVDTASKSFDREAWMTVHRQRATLSEVLSTRHLLWPFTLCIVINMAVNFGGSDISAQYSTGFMATLGVPLDNSALYTVLLIQLPGLAVCLIGMVLVERCGRRLLLLLGILLGVFAMLFVFFAGMAKDYAPKPAAVLGILGLLISTVGYYVGPSFIANLIPGELCPTVTRPLASGMSFAASWVPSVIIILLYPPLQLAVGPYAVLPLVVLGIVSFLFIFMYFPETKGRPVDEIVGTWIPGYRRRATEAETDSLLKAKNPNGIIYYGSGYIV